MKGQPKPRKPTRQHIECKRSMVKLHNQEGIGYHCRCGWHTKLWGSVKAARVELQDHLTNA